MIDETFTWESDGLPLTVGLRRAGSGPTVLLLPALSSISTLDEMSALQQRLAESFTAISIDWPGFGTLPRPFVRWRPDTYERYLVHLLNHVTPTPFAVIAAGHAAGYVIRQCAKVPPAEHLVLLSATWRGPLPTMTSDRYSQFPRIARAVDLPLIGPFLYKLNVNRMVVGMMARGHVYADPDWLTEGRMQAKLQVARASGARHSSVRFVAGCLDPFPNREELLAAARTIDVPTLSLFSEHAPRKSRLEMEALAELPNITTQRLPQGKLSFYEEFPDQTAAAIRAFLVNRG